MLGDVKVMLNQKGHHKKALYQCIVTHILWSIWVVECDCSTLLYLTQGRAQARSNVVKLKNNIPILSSIESGNSIISVIQKLRILKISFIFGYDN